MHKLWISLFEIKYRKHKTMDIDHKPRQKRWITHIFLLLFFQSVFFGSVFIVCYAIFTMNLQLCAFLVAVSALQRLARRSEFFINLVNKYIDPLSYYKSWKRIYEQQIPETTRALFALHPHSVFSYCITANMNSDKSLMSRMTGLASRFILAMPFIGLQLRLWGLQSVNHKNITRLMKKGKPLGLIPGGFEQATLTTPHQLRIFIKSRKGFIKYALQHQYTIYPVLSYYEHKAFWTFDYFTKIRLFLNKIKLPAVFFGMGFFWIYYPLNMDSVTIVGKGIKRKPQNTGQIENSELNQIHEEYVNQILRMHEKYRDQYGQSPMVIY